MEEMNNTQNNHEKTEEESYEDFEDEELDMEDVAVTAYNRTEALIELLIRKGVISEDEYEKMEEELIVDEPEEDGSVEGHSHEHGPNCSHGHDNHTTH